MGLEQVVRFVQSPAILLSRTFNQEAEFEIQFLSLSLSVLFLSTFLSLNLLGPGQSQHKLPKNKVAEELGFHVMASSGGFTKVEYLEVICM